MLGFQATAFQRSAFQSLQRVGGGYDDDDKPKRKRRFIRRVGDKLVVTTDASAALSSVQDEQETQEPQEAPTPQLEPVAAVQEISLAEIRTVAAHYQQQAKVLQMFRQRDWAEMVALYEALMRQQDEDDIEMLLLTC